MDIGTPNSWTLKKRQVTANSFIKTNLPKFDTKQKNLFIS